MNFDWTVVFYWSYTLLLELLIVTFGCGGHMSQLPHQNVVATNCRMHYKRLTQKKCPPTHFVVIIKLQTPLFNYMCPLQPYYSPEGDSGGLVCRCTEEQASSCTCSEKAVN